MSEEPDHRARGGAILVSRQARVTNGFVGLLVAGRVTLEGSARSLLTLSAPVAAAAAGLLLGVLVGRRRGGRFPAGRTSKRYRSGDIVS